MVSVNQRTPADRSPVNDGVVGAILVPVWAAIGAIAALVAEATIVVEKSE